MDQREPKPAYTRKLVLLIKILVVEDHPDSREILTTQLRNMGYHVAEATTGEEGIEKAQVYLPDLIVMDLGLPGIKGIEATRRLKQNPATAHIPVIALTAWNEKDFREEAEKAGIVEFLTKPTPRSHLEATIDRFLKEK